MKNLKENKKIFIIVGVVVLLIVLCIVGFILFGKGDDTKKEDKKDDEQQEVVDSGEKVTEDIIEEAYGMTKQQAIDLVKESFNSDTFEYSAEVNENSNYTVTAKNILNGTEYKFEVDPINESYWEIGQ